MHVKVDLIFAIKRQSFEEVYQALLTCPDVGDRQYRQSIKTAVMENGEDSHKIVHLLLDYGFNVHPRDAKNSKLLHKAIAKGYLDIVEKLLDYGADIDDQKSNIYGHTPLHTAVIYARYEIVQLLLQYDARINVKDKFGRTPFHVIQDKAWHSIDAIKRIVITREDRTKNTTAFLNAAVISNNSRLVEIILNGDVDPNGLTKDGVTPLYCNARSVGNLQEKIKIAEMLLKKGAKVNTPNKEGVTPLHLAVCMYDYLEYVHLLLMNNADVNAASHDNSTPLHYAATYGDTNICALLIHFGALLNEKTSEGLLPIHCAKRQGHYRLAQILEFGPSAYDSVVQFKEVKPHTFISVQ